MGFPFYQGLNPLLNGESNKDTPLSSGLCLTRAGPWGGAASNIRHWDRNSFPMAQLDTQGISEDVQHITGRVSSRRIFLDRSQGLKPT